MASIPWLSVSAAASEQDDMAGPLGVKAQLAIVNEAVGMLKNGSLQAQEHVTQLLRNLAQDPENRAAIPIAFSLPHSSCRTSSSAAARRRWGWRRAAWR